MISLTPPSFLEKPAPSQETAEATGHDSLQRYFQEIGKTPLLTHDEEVALAGRIRKGDQAARHHMIQANLRLVVKIALDYKDFGLPLLDLISEGNIGLVKAVDRYDPNKGGKLSSYAAWWIRQAIQRALANQSKTIRLPVHMVSRISKMRKVARTLAEDLGRDPTDEELAIELGMPVSKVAHLKSVSVHPASLDAPLGDDSGASTLGEIVGDDSARSPSESFREKTLSNDLHAMVDSLEEREAEIIRLRFGLDGSEGMTLEEVSRKFNVTRERIRQLQQLALMKMRRQWKENEAPRQTGEVHEADGGQDHFEVLHDRFDSRAKKPAAA